MSSSSQPNESPAPMEDTKDEVATDVEMAVSPEPVNPTYPFHWTPGREVALFQALGKVRPIGTNPLSILEGEGV